MQVGDYGLNNAEKLERALHGNLSREGKLSGGVGDEASPEALLAEYDRLGGLITKGGLKVKTGSFYDFAKRSPRAKPEVTFMTEVDGEILEVDEEEATVLEAAKAKTDLIKARKRKKVDEDEEKPKKLKKKKKNEDEE